jgi:hypothetical protein
MQLRFQDQDFSWKFLLAYMYVAFPILGVDFLRFHKPAHSNNGGHLRAAVRTRPGDLATGALARTAGPVIAGAMSSTPHTAGPASSSAHTVRPASKQGPAQARAAYSHLLEEFPVVVCASKWLPPVSHDIVHHIVTHRLPIASKFRKLDSEKLAAAKAEFKQLEEDDIIQCSTSPWSSPLYMVKKADGS